jgi:hypothetical protein
VVSAGPSLFHSISKLWEYQVKNNLLLHHLHPQLFLQEGLKCRVGQNRIYAVNVRYFRQGSHQMYGHTRCIYIYGSGQPYLNDHLSFTSAPWCSAVLLAPLCVCVCVCVCVFVRVCVSNPLYAHSRILPTSGQRPAGVASFFWLMTSSARLHTLEGRGLIWRPCSPLWLFSPALCYQYHRYLYQQCQSKPCNYALCVSLSLVILLFVLVWAL